MQFLQLALLFLFVQNVFGAVIVFNYQYSVTISQDWGATGTWQGGVVPGPNDDVYVIGGDYSSNGINTLTITTPVTVNSFFLQGNDVQVSLSNMLTTANFTIGGTGYLAGSGSASLVLTNWGSFWVTTSSSVDFSNVKNLVMNVSAGATVEWKGDCATSQLTINNNGNFTTTGDVLFDKLGEDATSQTFVFNNYGTFNIPTGETDFYGTLNNWGTVSVAEEAVLQIGGDDSTSNQVTKIFNWGDFVVDGQIKLSDSSTTTFNSGSLSGTGQVWLLGYGQYATLNFNVAITFPGELYLEGSTQINTNFALFASNITWCDGSRFLGSGPVTADYVSVQKKFYGSEGVTTLSGKNFTANKYFAQSSDALYFGSNSYLILGPNCEGLFRSGFWDPLDATVTNFGFVNYGYIKSMVHIVAYWETTVPTYNYGTIETPTEPGVFSDAAGMYMGEVINHGAIIATDTEGYTDYYQNSFFYTNLGLDGHQVVGSTGTFHGGLMEFTNSKCTDTNTISCYYPGLTEWKGRTTTIGNGAIATLPGTTFSIDGPGVVFERFVIVGNQLTGAYNLTVQQARRASFGYNTPFIINGTSLIVANNFTLEYGTITFIKNGKLVVNPEATFFVPAGISFTPVEATAGVYNYGLLSVDVDQDDYTTIETNVHNYGTIKFNTKIDSTSKPSGAAIYFNGALSGTGKVAMNVYANGDADKVSYFPDVACTYANVLEFTFHYTPQENDFYLIGQIQDVDDAPPCQGKFTLQTVNLPSSLQAVIMYDFPSTDGTSSRLNYLVVCASSNTTCSNYKRDPAFATTASGTTSGSGQSTTSGNGSGTSGTGSGQPTTGSDSTTNAGVTTNDNSQSSALSLSFVVIVAMLFFVL